MKLDKSYKVRVTPEQSRQIQELALELGFEWYFSGKQILHTEISNLTLGINCMVLGCFENTKNFYADTRFTEISADELIAMLTDLSKTQDEIDTTQNSVNILDTNTNILVDNKSNLVDSDDNYQAAHVSEFKVGDRVYNIGLASTAIHVVESNENGDPRYPIKVNGTPLRANGRLKTMDFPVLFHATQEKCDELSKAFGIQFEAPPKELTGSDLARAMLEKGYQYILCATSDVSELKAIELLKEKCDASRYLDVVIGFSYGNFDCARQGNSWKYAVPIDPKTGEPLTEAVLDE